MGNSVPTKAPDGFEDIEFDKTKVFEVKIEYCGS